ncbi:MAG: fatty acid desaturase family protein [Marinilabiliaceae bacterium]
MRDQEIIFPNDKNPDFINDLRRKVEGYFKQNNLSKYGNKTIVIQSVFMGILYILPYVLMLSGVVTSVLGVMLSWIAMGVGMAGFGMVLMHDANHRVFSRNQTVNRWLGKSLYLLGGFPPNWRHQHNTLHHGFTNIEGHDEDISPAGFLRFSPHRELHRVHRFQHIYAWLLYGLMTLSWVTVKDFSRIKNYKKEGVAPFDKKYGGYLTDLIVSKTFYYLFLLVLPIIVIPVAWYWIVGGFFVMHYVGGLILTTIFQTAHVVPSSAYPLPAGDGQVENNWAIHQLLTTSDFSPNSKIFSWMIGGLNYQVEHHLFPYISHVHYKKLSQLVKETAREYNLPYHYQENFYQAVQSHWKMLKMLGRQPQEADAQGRKEEFLFSGVSAQG